MPSQVKFGEKTLLKIVDKLRRYCHVDGCQNIDECPESCNWCGFDGGAKLDLNTAIAWDCAKQVERFVYEMEEFNEILNIFYINYRRFNSLKNLTLETMVAVELLEEIEDTKVDLKKLMLDLTTSCTSILTLRDVVSYHNTSYKKLWSCTRRGSEMAYSSVVKVTEAIDICRKHYATSKRKWERR